MGTRFAVVSPVLAAAALGPAQDKDKGQDDKLTPKQRSASKLAAKAAELMQRREWDAGIRLCDSALRLDPDNVNARWMRGLAYLRKGDPDQAIADFTNALEARREDAPGLSRPTPARPRSCGTMPRARRKAEGSGCPGRSPKRSEGYGRAARPDFDNAWEIPRCARCFRPLSGPP